MFPTYNSSAYRPFFPFGFHKFNNPYTYKDLPSSNNSNYNSSIISDEQNESSSDIREIKASSDYVFEIFGIKLLFDDILIISLIFFLYNEGVKDKFLFLTLILLLLS